MEILTFVLIRRFTMMLKYLYLKLKKKGYNNFLLWLSIANWIQVTENEK